MKRKELHNLHQKTKDENIKLQKLSQDDWWKSKTRKPNQSHNSQFSSGKNNEGFKAFDYSSVDYKKQFQGGASQKGQNLFNTSFTGGKKKGRGGSSKRGRGK